MRTEQTSPSSHGQIFAALWRLCLVCVSLAAAIYVPLLVSEPTKPASDQQIHAADIKATFPMSRNRQVSSTIIFDQAGNHSAIAMSGQ
jgi:hypothetical protein